MYADDVPPVVPVYEIPGRDELLNAGIFPQGVDPKSFGISDVCGVQGFL